jgi:glycine/D-amino acid oxidase-like deaminating enzyme
VWTDLGTFRTNKIVLSMGLWIQNYREELKILPHHLYVEKITTYWIKVTNNETLENGFPWFFTDSKGHFVFSLPH